MAAVFTDASLATLAPIPNQHFLADIAHIFALLIRHLTNRHFYHRLRLVDLLLRSAKQLKLIHLSGTFLMTLLQNGKRLLQKARNRRPLHKFEEVLAHE